MNILVTGGSRGIGNAIIRVFADAGFDIITCARSETSLQLLEQELRATGFKNTFYYKPVDVSVKAEVLQFAREVTEKFPVIDILVNNAGIFLPGGISEEEEGTFEKLLNTNMASAYHITRALLPNIRQSTGGYIFNICSTASIMAYVNGGSYCISKFALLGFSKVLREELKKENIKVTAVLPGATYTDSWNGSDLPEERFIHPKDVAKSIFDCYSLTTAVVEEIIIRPQLGDI